MVKKSFETRLRHMAERRGFMLQKSRARDPGSLTYGGYQLINAQYNSVVFGGGSTHNTGRGFGATIEEIEEFLRTGVNADQLDKFGRPLSSSKENDLRGGKPRKSRKGVK